MKILVLDVPALHLGYLGCYGNDWVGTPNIDRLASESVVFNGHFFDVDQPEPREGTGHYFISAPQSQTSQPADSLGNIVDRNGIGFAYIDGGPSLSLESLEKVAEKTSAALTERRPFIWVRFPSLTPPWRLPDDLLNSYCEEDDQPWPDPPSGFLENADDLPRLQNTYAAVVTAVDAHLETIFDQLREQNHLDDTLVCLTAPTALPLGEHGVVGLARPWAHEEFVHLPLLMRLPRGEHAGLRLDALTQPVDLFPTFLEFLGLAPPPSHGRSLWPLIRAEISEIRPYAYSALRSENAAEWALRTLAWACILPVVSPPGDAPRQAQLYVKPEDRWEVNDVRQHHLELAEELEKTLRNEGRGARGEGREKRDE